MTVIVDYGVGNLFSLSSSLERIGEKTLVSGEQDVILSADRVILPGVGAFCDAAEKLSEKKLDSVLKKCAEDGKPLLGICLGMQLLFEKSFEFGVYNGLGLLKGNIKPISETIHGDLKIPHIGWNALIFPQSTAKSRIFDEISEGECVYFVHSYHATDCEKSITACTEYGGILTAAVESGNVYGTQFHPEKSGDTGLRILKNFCTLR